MLIYIVARDSADGPELDVFTDLTLAQEWAGYIGASVQEENTIERDILDAMKASREPA